MSVRLGCVTLVLALFAVSAEAQVWGYVSQSFSLVRSDILEAADYTLLANITSRDGGEVNFQSFFYLFMNKKVIYSLQFRTTKSVCTLLPNGLVLPALFQRRRPLLLAACSLTSSDTLPETTPTVRKFIILTVYKVFN